MSGSVQEAVSAVDAISTPSVPVNVSESLTPTDSFVFVPVDVDPLTGSVTAKGIAPSILTKPYITTSGTFAFAPSLGEMVLYCFQRCGIARSEITASHLTDARFAANMILADWANEQVNLWEVDLQTVTLTQGQARYPVAPNTVLILDAYITLNQTSQMPVDLIIYPISRSEYAAIPEKNITGRPTTFWFDRLIEPSITLWQVPDASSPYYTLNYYRVRQTQDASLAQGTNVEIPYRFLSAFSDALCEELSVIYAPDRMQAFHTRAGMSWTKAKNRDVEEVPLFIAAGLQGYYGDT